MAANSSSFDQVALDFIECGYNWTGPVLGQSEGFSSSQAQTVIGFISCALAALLYGSNFLPFKFIETGDGFVCQWLMCTGIFLTGLVVQLVRQQPIFFPWTILGGAIWTTGNCCTVPIINLLGLSIGMLIWNSCSVLLGWASGRWGLLGICREVPGNEILNYVGVFLCLLATVSYVFVKPEENATRPKLCSCRKEASPTPEDKETARQGEEITLNTRPEDGQATKPAPQQAKFLPGLPQNLRRIIGVLMAVGSGACYAIQFIPAMYTQHHVIVDGKRASQNGLDYVFSQFCGIYLASTVYFAIYVAINHKSVLGKANIVLPSLLCGVLWGIATCCFFVANATLNPVITYPIISTLPGMIATLWGIFMFREIRGLRNFLILGAAFAFTISGVILVALSK